jgi:hypothetical protein
VPAHEKIRDPLASFADRFFNRRKHSVSGQLFYRWRAKHGGMKVSDAGKLKEVEEENSIPKRGEISKKQKRYCCRRSHALLCRQGFEINRKKVCTGPGKTKDLHIS